MSEDKMQIEEEVFNSSKISTDQMSSDTSSADQRFTGDLVLSLRDISKNYRQGRSTIEILRSVNLDVYAGDLIAIVGASGSGKSTLLHIAALLDEASSGSIKIGSDPVREYSDLKNSNITRQKHIGFVYQYHHLLKDFNARENVAMPLLISGEDKKSSLEKAEKLLSEVGLGNRMYNMPGELSGGEMQRVAIARSIISNPGLILADEPTGNLDPLAAQEIFELFLSLAQTNKTAVVMVTHNMELAAKMHKVYKLDYGLSDIIL